MTEFQVAYFEFCGRLVKDIIKVLCGVPWMVLHFFLVAFTITPFFASLLIMLVGWWYTSGRCTYYGERLCK